MVNNELNRRTFLAGAGSAALLTAAGPLNIFAARDFDQVGERRRPNERGFEESVVHSGGGIGQRSDPWGNDYFDPALKHHGEYAKYQGYCTNIFFDLAIQYIQENRDNPFFMYLPTNSPHMPLIVPESYVEQYRRLGLDDTTARTYCRD